MGAGPKLISFPLFVMFMITLVFVVGEAGGSFSGTSSSDFAVSRDVDNYQVGTFDNFVQSSYDNYGEDPGRDSKGGDWTLNETNHFIEDQKDLMDSVFGEQSGHYDIIYTMLSFMRELYDNTATRIDENDVRYFISIDPVSLEEWKELQGSNITLSDTLVFVGIFFGVVVLVGIVGIRIFGSGLAETSINFIIKLTLFLLLWGLLSIGAGSRLLSIPVLGIVIWSLLTFVYMMGVFLTLSGTGDD